MNKNSWDNSYLKLAKNVVLKHLEQYYVYHIKRDELYEVDNKAIEFLKKCNGTSRGQELTADFDFVEYCIDEGLLEKYADPSPVEIKIFKSPIPSLRYLELQLLNKCNLKCKHCYLGASGRTELVLKDAFDIAKQFSQMSGLRLIISGGEPMLYPQLKEFLEMTNSLNLRRVLLTNGTLINSENIKWLNIEEVQFSLDGWRNGHDVLRGNGCFEKTMRGIEITKEAGIPISLSTMVHKGNLDEFDMMGMFAQEIEAIEWGVDALCSAGSMNENVELNVPPDKAARYMNYAFGGGYHGSSEGYACGRHLMTVMSDGIACKCGFYTDNPLGDARKNLENCWLKLKHIPVIDLECKGCSFLDDCAGGCRFRAPGPLAADPVMCSFYNLK